MRSAEQPPRRRPPVELYSDEASDASDDERAATSALVEPEPSRASHLLLCFAELLACLCCAEPADLGQSRWACATVCAVSCAVVGLYCAIIALATGAHAGVVHNEAAALGLPLVAFPSPPRWVDVVFTWVNGSHPEVSRQLLDAYNAGALPYRPHDSRYRDDGLFEYAVRSLLAADGLMPSVRHVYIVTSGELPSWLPTHSLRPVGPRARRRANRTARGGREDERTCHAIGGFTTTTLSTPLEPLIRLSRRRERRGRPGAAGGEAAAAAGVASAAFERPAGGRRLFIVPHSALFPAPSLELPTFNSNAILAVLHRIPQLAPWFLYADDDSIISNPDVTLAAWWDHKHAAQRLYMSAGHRISRVRPKLANNWEEAMSYMAWLLDAARSPPPPSPPLPPARRGGSLARAAPPPPLLSPPPLPPPPLVWPPVTPCPARMGEPARPAAFPTPNQTANHATRRSKPAASTSAADRRRARGLMRYYARPQHMPVLFSRDLLYTLEARWPSEFERTRRHKLRVGDEIELNFFYHHYLRVLRYPVSPTSSRRVEFLFAQRCAGARRDGAAHCARLVTSRAADFITFNDDATSRERLDAGLARLHRLLRDEFGTFRAPLA